MLQIIHCRNCDKDSFLNISFKMTINVSCCSECHKSDSKEWSFYFCDLKCFQQWLLEEEIFEEGIPCQDCRETGWSAGFESNGVCPTCCGKKRVINTTIKGFSKV
jgi:hypothetical protein